MAITGTKRKHQELVTVEDILFKTSGGYDIYMYYLGKVARIMQRPWSKPEKKLSWGIYPYNGVWMWKDKATEESGNALHFVMKYFGLNLNDACNKVAHDFQIKPNVVQVNFKSPIITWDAPTEEDKEYVHIAFTSKPWTDRHHQFYEGTGVTPEFAEKYNTFAVKDCAIKHRKFRIRPNEVVWAYYCPEEDAVKLYFPERGQDEYNPKFRNNVSGTHLWNYENLMKECGGGCEKGIIQKSMKDLLVTAVHTPYVIASQNEQAKMFLSPHTIEKVGKLFNNVWMAFGSDPDGVAKSQKVTEHTKWNWVNPEKKLLPDINDFYGLAKKFGPQAVEDLLKYKKFL